MARKDKRKKKEEEKKVWYPIAFLDNQTNWLIFLMIFLPIVYSNKTADPTLAIRFTFQSAFLLCYIIYFHLLRGRPIITGLPGWVKWFFYLSLVFLVWNAVLVSGATNFGEALYETTRYGTRILMIYVVVQMFLDQRFNVNYFFRAVIFVALVHSFIGIDQYLEWGVTKIPGTASPYGLMVNRNLYGSFQVLLLPLVMYFILTKKGFWRVASLVIFCALIISIFFSDTRAAWISAITVMILCSGLALLYLKEYRKPLLTCLALGVGLVAVLVVSDRLSSEDSPQKKTAANEQTEKPKKKAKKSEENKVGTEEDEDEESEVFRVNDGSINERLIVWQESRDMFLDNPMLGVGPGNWKVVIPFYRIGGIRNDYGKIIRIRPHNIYIQTLTETGVPGFLLHYATWLIILILSIKVLIRKDLETWMRLFSLLLLFSLIAFSIDGLFSFPMERLAHTTILAILSGLILGVYARTTKVSEGPWSTLDVKKSRMISVAMILFMAWNIHLAKERSKFDYHIRRAKVLVDKKKNQQAITEANAGKSTLVSIDLSAEPLEMIEAVALHNLKRFDEAMEEVTIAEKYNPYSTRISNTKGTIYTNLKEYDKAIECYLKALEISPRYEVSLKNLALNYYYTDNYEACLETLKKVNIKGEENFLKLRRSAKYKLKVQQEEATAEKKEE